MSIRHAIEIEAAPDVIFGLYADVVAWPSWDQEVRAVSLPDGLVTGAMGWLKPRSGPTANITVAEVTLGSSFLVESALPFGRMRFDHQLEAIALGTRVTHTVEFVGPLAFLFRRLIGATIEQTLPTTLRGLKQHAEAKARYDRA